MFINLKRCYKMTKINFTEILETIINTEIEIKFLIFSVLFLCYYIYALKTKIVKQKECPHCKTNRSYRTHQNVMELYLLKLENYKKYKCLKCARSFYIKSYH